MGEKKEGRKKEGRNRRNPTDMSSEGGRLMLRDLIAFKETGFNPFVPESFMTEEFWKSRKEFQSVPFGTFLGHAEHMAKIAIAQMPQAEREKEEGHIKNFRRRRS